MSCLAVCEECPARATPKVPRQACSHTRCRECGHQHLAPVGSASRSHIDTRRSGGELARTSRWANAPVGELWRRTVGSVSAGRVVMGLLFFPRGGSAQVSRYLAF